MPDDAVMISLPDAEVRHGWSQRIPSKAAKVDHRLMEAFRLIDAFRPDYQRMMRELEAQRENADA
jgi:hypothetical protein